MFTRMPAEPSTTANWTFVPSDPPRSGWFHVWEPSAPGGLFAAAEDAGQSETVVFVPPPRSPGGRSPRPVRRDVAGIRVPVAQAIDRLAGAIGEGEAPSLRAWSHATRLGLGLVARGHLVPAVTRAGFDAWQVEPLDPADHARLRALAASFPLEAHALSRGDDELRVADPAWLIRQWWDALVDGLVRTGAAEQVGGGSIFAAAEAVPAEPLRPWLAAAYGHVTGSVRLGLRFEPTDPDPDPDAGTDAGTDADTGPRDAVVSVFARSAVDPSLVISTDQLTLWGPEVGAVLGASAADELLAALGRAAAVWPPLWSLLDLPPGAPLSAPVDADQIASIGAVAADLDAMGVEIHWPAEWCAELRPRLVASASPAAGREAGGDGVAAGMLDFDAVLNVRWEVLCDGTALAPDELAALSGAKQSVIWLRNGWVRVDPSLIARLTEPPPELVGPTGLAALAGGTVLDPLGDLLEVRVEGDAKRWAALLRNESGPPSMVEPPGLLASLRPYQRQGLGWLVEHAEAGFGGILADDMGLGKTIQLIAAHLALHQPHAVAADGLPFGPTLVVCPTSLVGNWEREVERFAPGIPIVRADRSSALAALVTDSLLDPESIVITTYGVLRREAVSSARFLDWGLVIADEAQAAKNSRSGTARALRELSAQARFAVTGTPIENRLAELWALLDWTTPGLLGSAEMFRQQIAVPIENGGNAATRQLLMRLVQPFLLRRLKSDPSIVPDLPPRIDIDRSVTLSGEQLSLYQALVDRSLYEIKGTDGVARHGLVFRLLTGLKQIANHPAHYLHETEGPIEGRSPKFDLAVETACTAVESGQPVLVFSQYVEMCRLLSRRFTELGVEHLVLDGSASSAARDRMVEAFQAGEVSVLIVSLRAGGTGLNLTAARHVIHVDRWWNPAVEDQATDRAWRIGQRSTVAVHRLVCAGTVEERIAAVIGLKRQLADSVLGGGDDRWISRLDDSELASLVELRRSTHPGRALPLPEFGGRDE